MILPIKKIPAFLLAVILSLSLCNTETVFATGSIKTCVTSLQSGREDAVGTPSTEQPPMDGAETEQEPSLNDGQTEAVAQQGNGTEEMPDEDEPDEMEPSADSILPEDDIVWKEASTVNELLSLLEDGDFMNAGGHIRITDDLVIPADDYCMIWPDTPEDMPLVVDLGAHTLYVEGWLRSFGNIKYIGAGGENGLIRVRAGGRANVRSAVFMVTEEGGYAIWQENGSILSYEPASGSVGEIHFAQALEGEVSTFEELTLLLEDEYWKANGGYIRVTDNLVVPAGEEHKFGWLDSKALTTLDMGKYTLSVEGTLGIYKEVKLIGAGGENGLCRVRTGGELSVQAAALIVEEGGYAIWQEEGSLLEYSPNENSVGEVHFAERPVAVPFSFISPDTGLPVAVVHDGQTPEDVLPATDSVRLYFQGVMDQGTYDTDKLISVAWDLEPYREQLNKGERVFITGSYTEAVAFQTPVCLVVFQNGNPATFLNGHGAEAYRQPVAIVNVELAKPELGCRFEWSQDGGTWLPAEFTSIPNGDGALRFKVTFPQEEPPVYPYYLSAVVDYPDGSVGYSDVIVFTEAVRACSSGGNRGGGTDITDPPTVPKTDSSDDFGIGGGSDQETESPENSGGDESGSPEPDSTSGIQPGEPDKLDTTPDPTIEPSEQSNTTPDPTIEPSEQSDTTPVPTIEPSGQSDTTLEREKPGESSEPKTTIPPVEEIPVIGQAAPPAGAETDLQASSQIIPQLDGEKSNLKPDDTTDGISGAADLMPTDPVPPNSAGKTVIAEAVSPQIDNEGGDPLVKAVSIVVGGTSTAVVIGAAGVYHSKSLRNRLWAALKKLVRTKK